MHYAENGYIPPQEWEHDPNIKSGNKYNSSFDSYHSYHVSYYTVADFLE